MLITPVVLEIVEVIEVIVEVVEVIVEVIEDTLRSPLLFVEVIE